MHRPAGFTLVEVMVALALTTALLVATYAGLWVGMKSNARVANTITDNAVDRTVTYFLRKQLRQVRSEGLGDATQFGGGPQSLHFSSRYFRGQPALYTFQIGMMPGAGGKLTLKIEVAHPLVDTTPVSDTLIRGIRNLVFEYFGQTRSDDEARWHPAWNDSDRLPQLVRMRYQRGDADRRDIYLAVAGVDANQRAQAE